MSDMDAQVRLGVALAGGKLASAIQREDNVDPTVIFRDHVLRGTDPRTAVASLCRTLAESLQAIGVEMAGVDTLGISIGGHIGTDGRSVHFAPDLVESGTDWKAIDLSALVHAATGKWAHVENDANCMAAYQRSFGSAKECRNFITVYLAPDIRGLGCGIVIGGEVVRGATGGAGELGHLVVLPRGPLCRCGNRGCLEALLVVDNFDRELNWGDRQYPQGLTSGAELVRSGSKRATYTFERFGRYLGQGLANMINMLNPEMIILGGPPELVQENPGENTSAAHFMSEMRDAIRDNTFSSMGSDCQVRVAELDLGIAAAGALLLAQGRNQVAS